jgi:hypothetical protein
VGLAVNDCDHARAIGGRTGGVQLAGAAQKAAGLAATGAVTVLPVRRTNSVTPTGEAA